MSGAFKGSRTRRYARRQELMARLCRALGPVVGPRVTLEAYGGRGIAVLVEVYDEGRGGGACVTHAAPWIPSPTTRTDSIRTARGVAEAVHSCLWEESIRDATSIGPSRPRVDARGGIVFVRFFGVHGEPLPVVEVPLVATEG
jgi:hypothetical protein